MLITKNIGFAEILVDSILGRVWVNSPSCVLRIQGINFRNQREKFSMIDIKGDEGIMVEGDLMTSPLDKFIEDMIALAMLNNFTSNDMDYILQMAAAANTCKKENTNDNTN